MTYRERRQAKAERLREWAGKRQADASATLERDRRFTGDIAFNTQPGHIPERARIIRQEDRAHESLRKAAQMEARADGIDAQADRAIYSDDPDAVERLEERIAELDAKRQQMKKVNAAYRKRDDVALAALGSLSAEGWDRALEGGWHDKPHPAYELQNLGGNIARLRKRIEEVRTRVERVNGAQVDGVLIEEVGDYARVTFAEKPDRSVLTALKAAGFRWGGGSWVGKAVDLPDDVRQGEG